MESMKFCAARAQDLCNLTRLLAGTAQARHRAEQARKKSSEEAHQSKKAEGVASVGKRHELAVVFSHQFQAFGVCSILGVAFCLLQVPTRMVAPPGAAGEEYDQVCGRFGGVLSHTKGYELFALVLRAYPDELPELHVAAVGGKDSPFQAALDYLVGYGSFCIEFSDRPARLQDFVKKGCLGLHDG